MFMKQARTFDGCAWQKKKQFFGGYHKYSTNKQPPEASSFEPWLTIVILFFKMSFWIATKLRTNKIV